MRGQLTQPRLVERAYFQDGPQVPADASQDVRVARIGIPDDRLEKSNDAATDLAAWTLIGSHHCRYLPRIEGIDRYIRS
jgi:hypothetical protein